MQNANHQKDEIGPKAGHVVQETGKLTGSAVRRCLPTVPGQRPDQREQEHGGSRRQVHRMGKGWGGGRIPRKDALLFLIRYNHNERSVTVPQKSVGKGLVRGTLSTEQIKEGGTYLLLVKKTYIATYVSVSSPAGLRCTGKVEKGECQQGSRQETRSATVKCAQVITAHSGAQ